MPISDPISDLQICRVVIGSLMVLQNN